jgi:signal transduction histidine kinase
LRRPAEYRAMMGLMSTHHQATRPTVAEIAVIGCFVVLAVGLWAEGHRRLDVTGVASLALHLMQVLPLAMLRSRPWAVFVVVAGAQVGVGFTESGTLSPGPLFVAAAVYGVACYTTNPGSLVALPAAALAVFIPLAQPTRHLDLLTTVAVLAMLAVAWLLGRGRQRMAGTTDQLRRLAAQLRREQQINQQRAVQAERARIAVDLHDIVAHHISAIAVQAHATADDLDSSVPATASVARIAVAADTALTEMRRMLKLLTTSDDRPTAGAEPSLAHLDPLVQIAEAAGCEVSVQIGPDVVTAPGSVQVCVYRILQEAITNIVKHAPGTAVDIDTRADTDRIILIVGNSPPDVDARPVLGSGPGSGLGVIGMRERAALFDGILLAEPRADGGWQVTATLPTRTR